jgi:RNA polymerase sigma factor (sigma-70 family)
MKAVLRHLRQAALLGYGDGRSDAQLLEAFADRREEAAFAALLRRHGPMVLGVCRRVLGNVHDADDAFQATFLVLVRKAASVRPPELVGPWLYGVAYRTSLKARAMNAKRRSKERQAEAKPPAHAPDGGASDELLERLDAELNRLPDKYRVPVVLCELEGRSRKEVARRLGLPEGTLSWRLSQARKLLARRLSQHGLTLSAGSVAALVSGGAKAGVPLPLLMATTRAALQIAAGSAATAGVVSAKVAALTEGVLKAMFLTKLRIATVALVLFGAVGTGGGLVYRSAAAEQPGARPRPEAKAPAPATPGPAKGAGALAATDDYWPWRAHQHYNGDHSCQACHEAWILPGHALPWGHGFTAPETEQEELKRLLNQVRAKDRAAVGKAVTVGRSVRGIEAALARQRRLVPDKQAELEALEEIGKAVQEMKAKLQQPGGR